ncbi:cytochrome b5 isoform X2 [Harpegnathos saltator]|uniref:cytochrome b5 isoform X2 n=1 Tax=Harpegnathos saltator TaxID=610380 RepID=UPI00058CA902|nr:cytochrome b5 isoform X2 [Harpegnathos saltator]
MADKDIKEKTATTVPVKLFTREEVLKQSTLENSDTWIIIHNEIYNVTSFLNEHPGGEEVLLEQNGLDATEAFEDIGHSSDARELMISFKIGELVEAERVKERKKVEWSNNNSDDNNSSSWRSWLIPIALGVLATLVYRYFISTH